MAKASKVRTKKRAKPRQGLESWQKRALMGLLALLALLTALSMIFGLESIQTDKDLLIGR